MGEGYREGRQAGTPVESEERGERRDTGRRRLVEGERRVIAIVKGGALRMLR